MRSFLLDTNAYINSLAVALPGQSFLLPADAPTAVFEREGHDEPRGVRTWQ